MTSRTLDNRISADDQQNEKTAGHLLHKAEKNPAIFTYCDIIYTKAYRFEISGEEQVSGRMPWEIVNTN